MSYAEHDLLELVGGGERLLGPEDGFWLDSDPLARGILRGVGVIADTPLLRGLRRVVLLLFGLMVTGILLSAVVELFSVAPDCDEYCRLTLLLLSLSTGALVAAMAVAHVETERMVRQGAIRLLFSELSRPVSRAMQARSRARFRRWGFVSIAIGSAFCLASAIQVFTDTYSLGISGETLEDTSTNVGLIFATCVILPLWVIPGVAMMGLSTSLFLDCAGALQAMFREFGERILAGDHATPKEVLNEYLRLRAHTREQSRQWQLTVTWLVLSSLLFSLAMSTSLILSYQADADSSLLVRMNSVVVYAFYFAVAPFCVLGVLRVNEHLDRILVKVTEARVFSAEDRFFLREDLLKVETSLTLYGVVLDSTILGALGLGALSLACNLLFD